MTCALHGAFHASNILCSYFFFHGASTQSSPAGLRTFSENFALRFMREVLCRAAGLARPSLALAPDNCPSLRSISVPQLISGENLGRVPLVSQKRVAAHETQDGFYQCEVNPEAW